MKLLVPLITSTLIFIPNVLGQCNFRASDNSYNASWYLDPKSSLIRFQIDIQTSESNFWTGIGFGHSMIGGDFVLASIIGGQVYDVSDRNGVEYGDPIKDARQDIKQVYTKFQDRHLTIAFSRAVDTGDEKDDVPLLDKAKIYCQDFIFPVGGGPTIGGSGGAPIRQKHTQTPKTRRVCNIDQCIPQLDHTDQVMKKTPIVEHRTGPPAHGPPGYYQSPRQRPEFSIDSAPQELESTVSEEAVPFVGHSYSVRPAGGNHCSFSQDGYEATWIYEPATRSVVFTIDSRLSHNRWLSIGFGQSMQKADMIIMYDFRGFVEIRDAYSRGYAEPTIDPRQDVQALGFNYTGAVVRAAFRRAVDTGDSEDVVLQDPGLSQCQYFVFPTSGGEIVPYTNQRFHLKQHDEKPVVKLVCDLWKCVAKKNAMDVEDHAQPEQAFEDVDFEASSFSGESTLSQRIFESRDETPSSHSGGKIEVLQKSTLPYKLVKFPPISAPECPKSRDHIACKLFIDDYLEVVFSNLPKISAVWLKACSLLQEHQGGIIYQECCSYLTNICTDHQ